jgi:hypothetical protein
MRNYTVGDKVVCVDSKSSAGELTYGQVYTVAVIDIGRGFVQVEGVQANWLPERFEKVAVETVTIAPAEPSSVEKAAKAYAEAISEYKVRAEALNKLFAQREEILQQVKDANAARVAASEVVENARKALDNAAWGRE